jgi:signal transduction histidine kinase/CheY-like chemotaxis protein
VSLPLLSLAIRLERDVVAARQRARQVASLIGFEQQDQTRIATAVSEISRNAFTYGGGGKIEFVIEGKTSPQVLLIRISDQGPGIANIEQVLAGEHHSTTGMGLGIIGSRRLMDGFDVQTAPGKGTSITLKKLIPDPARLLTSRDMVRIADELARQTPNDLIGEVQLQNTELMRALEDLQKRQEELLRVNSELEDTNRGVVALYAELDERADHLRRADQLKSRFLSNMSHEFRSPLNSISGLCRLLLDSTDGDLNSEQHKQVTFIRQAADGLTELVNDLLDLAKVEAGKFDVHPIDFEVADLFGALRGMLRPLLVTDTVRLIFDDPELLPPMRTDEGKVSQILRNFISNALKFTERGEVRVSAALSPERDTILFSVSDTGIGIAYEDQERIFDEFAQVDSPLQKKVKGTGLGLPLTRRLAELLGGSVSVKSEVGVGSTFAAAIPVMYSGVDSTAKELDLSYDSDGIPVLILENAPQDILLYQKFLYQSGYSPIITRTTAEARDALKQIRPAVVVIDIMLKGENSWTFMAEIKRDPRTSGIPVLIVSTVDDQQKGLALGAEYYALKPLQKEWLLDKLRRLCGKRVPPHILIVDDDDISRYLIKHALATSEVFITECNNGADALKRAREEHPDIILLDLVMAGMDGVEVLDHLKQDPDTAGIPVIVITSELVAEGDHSKLSEKAVAVVSKRATLREEIPAAIAQALAGSGFELQPFGNESVDATASR